ncbi:DUF4153 domain-containing protein [Amycolatopsis sp. TNS106]|uniref:DUF4153 domain-containing protein n=1 Tax=Amycolatopsis sp. TNS106 TaxID=2861750 RepID=UPI001C55E399|nr:DUF4173 domain-containing protein [Amycolatopsis sp. TNS106]QXV58835.1 DUF4173 domain-containing protein [Amycolatopsis sp. TNS106]
MSEDQEDRQAHASPPSATTTLPSAPPLPVLMRPRVPPKSAIVPLPGSVLPAAVAAGLIAAFAMPDRPGAGWFVAGLAFAVAVFFADKRARGDAEPHFRLVNAIWAAAALALLAVGMVRASVWLNVLCVLAALVAGSLAVVGKRTVNTIIYDVFAVPIEALLSLPWIGRGLAKLGKKQEGRAKPRFLVPVLTSALLLLVFVPLLRGADAAFANVVDAVIPELNPGTFVRWGFFFTVAAFAVTGACYLLAAPPLPADSAAVDTPRKRLAHRLEWTLPLGVLVALFTSFVVVRLVVLFGGTEYLLATSGLTAAEYARSGFWQLSAITVLTLLLVAAALRWAPKSSAADRAWQRGLLGALSVLSLMLVASALSRMWTYQQAYGFTVLRLLVEVCELWIGLIFVLVLVSLLPLRSAWLPRAAIGAAVAALLGLAVLDPERFIADRNIDRLAHGKTLDTGYLSRFSADVVPSVDRLPEPLRSCVLRPVVTGIWEDGWREWNLSRSLARQTPVAAKDGVGCRYLPRS